MTALAYVSLEHLENMTGAPAATGALLRLRPGTDGRALSDRLTADGSAVAYLSTHALANTMRDAFSLYDTLVGLMLAFAALMAAALLFNAMSANLAERLSELGTLRAAGMGAGVLGRLVAAENLLLAVVGIPVGLGAGALLADWFMSTYQTQGYHWDLDMRPMTPVLVGLGVLVAAVLAQLPAIRGVRRLDIARIVRERSL
jgi:putative ABC transport system permease protein